MDLLQLTLGHLRLDIDFEAAVRIPLSCLHPPEPTFEMLQDFGLIGDCYFGIDGDRKVENEQLPKHSGERPVRQILHAHEGVQEPADLKIVLLLVLDACIRDLISSALVSE